MTSSAPTRLSVPQPTARSRWARAGATVVGVGLILGLGAAPVLAVPPRLDPQADRPVGGPSVTPGDPVTVFVGVAGLRWSDVDDTTMPTLWSMIDGGSVGSIPGGDGGRCPREAWTTLSAGQVLPAHEHAGAHSAGQSPSADPGKKNAENIEPFCPPMPAIDAPAEVASPASLLGWATPTEPMSAAPPADSAPGTLGSALDASGTCTTAIGPGAAIMLADRAGRVGRYAPTLSGLTASELTKCPVVALDAGGLPDATSNRKMARERLDDQLSQLRRMVTPGSRILVAGIVDTVPTRPELQVVVDWRSPGHVPHWLTSDSTRRRQGVANLLDLAHTISVAGGADVTESDATAIGGTPLVDGEIRRMGVKRTVENLSYLSVLAKAIDTLMPVLVALMALALVGGLGGAFLAHRAAVRRGDPARPGPHARRVLAAVLLVTGAAPVAASIAALSRWWVQPAPIPALTASLALAAAIVATAAWGVSRLLPSKPLALAAAVSGITWLVLTMDGLTGTVLQQGSILGSSPELGARFYGFNNMTFAVYATAAIILAGSVASFLPRGRILAIAAIGVITTAVDGLPQFGADFGGVFALVPAFAVLGMLTSRTRITWRRIATMASATIAVVALVATLDWLTPGTPTHVGAFVERLITGRASGVIWRKALGAWDTVANPGGAVALAVVVVAIVAVLRPRRCGLASVADAYDEVPLLRPVVIALVVVACVGSVLNDSGIIIAAMILLTGTAILTSSILSRVPHPAGLSRARPPAMTPTLLATVGGFFIVLLLASGVLTSAVLRPATETATAGDDSRVDSSAAVSEGNGIVVIGTTGITWDDITSRTAPTLTSLLVDGAAAGGVSQPTGAASNCAVGGWLSLSAGQLATVSSPRAQGGGPTECPTPAAVATGNGAIIDDWQDLVDLQRGSPYQAKLGILGRQLGGASCATAVGPGAALAMAGPDGTVGRYRTLSAALTEGSDAFTCPVTLVDAGDATTPRAAGDLPAPEQAALREQLHSDQLAAIDSTVSGVLEHVPAGTAVVVVDLARTPGIRPVLGVTLVQPGLDGPDQARFLTSSATRTDGIARSLDIPATLLSAAGLDAVDPIQDTPLAYGSLRPSESTTTANALAGLTSLDLARRDAYVYFIDVPLYLGLALAGLCLAGSRIRRITPIWRARLGAWARGTALFLGAVPTAAFLVSLAGWWHFEKTGVALAVATVVTAGAVAGVAALAPRRPLWLAPGILAGITFAVLTVDGLIGTPLNRASPLGSAPTFGARFYGFGNPTFSIYAVAALVLAAALAQWQVYRGHRWRAVGAVSVVGIVTMVVDVWPTFGADLGGGLVLVPGFAVLGISASGSRVTWRRVLAVGAAGIGAVAAVGVIDWLRPPEQRSHLGRFVGQVVEGEAVGTVLRKASYALRSVLDGFPVWVTIAVLVLTGIVLFAPRRFAPRWWARAEGLWPLLQSATLGLWIVLVAGSLVNDFGVRIAMIALIPAVPLYTAIALSTPPELSSPAAPDQLPYGSAAR